MSSNLPPLPSLIKSQFKDFTLITDKKSLSSSIFLTYSAVSVSDDQLYTIRFLNHESETYQKNRNTALTLYFQELFYLCARFGSFLSQEEGADGSMKQDSLIDFRSFCVEGDSIAFVMKESHSLSNILSNDKEKPALDTEKMLKEIYASLNFIKSRFDIATINMNPENVCVVRDSKTDDGAPIIKYYLSGWTSKIEGPFARYAPPEVVTEQDLKKIREANSAAEIYALGLIGLETTGIEYKTWKSLPSLEDDEIYESVLFTMMKKVDKLRNEAEKQQNESLNKLLIAMLKKSPSQRIEETSKAIAAKLKFPNNVMSVPEGGNLNPSQEEEQKIDEIINKIIKLPTNLASPQIQLEKLIPTIKGAFQSAQPQQILTISISNNLLAKMDRLVLRSNTTWTNLEVLSFSNLTQGDKIADALGSNNSWKKLWKFVFTNNNLTEKGVAALANNTSWPNLEELNLSNNQLRPEAADALANNTAWVNLKWLDLANNQLEEKGAEALAKNESWTQLKILNLTDNKLGEKGAIGLAKNTSWKALKKLNLNNNQLGDGGAEAICKNETWMGLEIIGLSGNSIGPRGFEVLLKNQKWQHIKEILLPDSQYGGSYNYQNTVVKFWHDGIDRFVRNYGGGRRRNYY